MNPEYAALLKAVKGAEAAHAGLGRQALLQSQSMHALWVTAGLIIVASVVQGLLTGLGGFQAPRVGLRAMLEHPFARLESQVQAVEFGVTRLEQIDHPQTLEVVLEALAIRPDLQQAVVECVLSGVTERRVPDVVCQCDGLDQILVQAQRSGDGPCNLRHLERVRHAGAKQVAFMVEKDLRLVDQPAKRRAVHDAIAVALKRIAIG